MTTIHLWAPGVFGFKGGIQTYSLFLTKALADLRCDTKLEVHLMHDINSSESVLRNLNVRYCLYGRWPKQLRVILFAIRTFLSGLLRRPCLVITTHLNFSPVAYLLWLITRRKYWIVAHGVESWGIKEPLIQKALSHAEKILCVSHYTRERLLKEQGLNPNKLVVLFDTYDDQRFRILTKPDYLLQRHGLQPKQRIILTVNRLSQSETYKGYEKVLKAMPAILRSFPEAHYLIVGTGDDYDNLISLIKDLSLEKSVTAVGFVQDDELCNYYNLCDVFVMPSKLEGFGIVYLEALACGKPVLGGNQDGAIDALCQGQMGALVGPDNIEEIGSVIVKILNRQYPLQIMYQPERLSQTVKELFGYQSFKMALASHLDKG